MSVERTLILANDGFEDLNAALAWVVRTYDREFSGAQMVKLDVEQIMRSGAAVDDPWQPVWTASVRGMVEEPVA